MIVKIRGTHKDRHKTFDSTNWLETLMKFANDERFRDLPKSRISICP